MEFFVEFVFGEWHWYTLIRPRIVYNFKVYGWKSIEKKNHFLNNKCIIIKKFGKKTLWHERGGDFTSGLCINFSIFFYLVMFHEPQTWDPTLSYIGSRLNLTQNEFWVSKCCHATSKAFCLCLK